MHSSVVTKCFDKNVHTALCQLFHQSHKLRNINSASKRQSPFLTLKSNFTYILDSVLEKQIFCNTFTELKQSLNRNAVGQSSAIKTITEIFKIPREDAKVIVTRNQAFTYTTKKAMIDNCEKLKIAGVSLPVIRNNMDLLSEDSDVLQKKITYVQEHVDDIKSALPLLYHSASSLEQLFDSKPGVTCEDSIRNKVKFYKEEWKVENDEVYSLISKYLYCMIHHHDNTVAVIKLLLDKNVTVKSLLKYNWNVLIDSKVAKERLKIYSKFESVLPIKPWILNCKESEFTRKLTTLNEKSTGLLEYSGVVKFLSEKTGYRKKLIEFKLSTRNLQNKTLNQVKLITDLIIKEGYDWHDIVCSIEVLHLSGELIINRFSQLKNINYRPHFLKFLLLSDKDFVEYVNTCKK